MFLRLAILASAIYIASGVVQEITLYAEPGQKGDGVLFRSKYGSFGYEFQAFVQSAKSYCATGWWKGFNNVNFNGSIYFDPHFYAEPYCRDTPSFAYVKSLRHYGGSDTAVPSISLYSSGLRGEEIIITAPAGSHFAFTPNAAIVTGATDWSLYPTENFTGNATCLVADTRYGFGYFDLNTTAPIGSVLRGCNPPRVARYLKPEKLY